jgi:hypothetical protein
MPRNDTNRLIGGKTVKRTPSKGRRAAIVGCVAGLTFGAVAAWYTAAHGAETFRIRLTTVPIEAATSASVTGSGSAVAILEGRRLKLEGSFEGLQGPVTVARLHHGLAKGVRGPAIREVAVTGTTTGSLSGEVELTREQLEGLRAGRLYIQIHSESAADGNLWGWLLP